MRLRCSCWSDLVYAEAPSAYKLNDTLIEEQGNLSAFSTLLLDSSEIGDFYSCMDDVEFTSDDPVFTTALSDFHHLSDSRVMRCLIHHGCFHEDMDARCLSRIHPSKLWDAWSALETMSEVVSSVSCLQKIGKAHSFVNADTVKLTNSNKDRRGFEALSCPVWESLTTLQRLHSSSFLASCFGR
eukprot:gene13575-19449_t